MTAAVRPVFQKQGPTTNCVIKKAELGWVSCTAYAMAMGVDSATAGARRPSGCKIRELTGDREAGLSLSQVAAVAQEAFGVRVTVRTGRNAISTAAAIREIRNGRGFVLQGNTGALPRRLQAGGGKACNHAIWVNEVRRGTPERPGQALVYDPAADGRRAGIDKAPTWWDWDDLLAFAAALVLTPQGRRLGPGRMYAGFIPKPPTVTVQAPVLAAATHVTDGTVLRFKATRTTPFPDRVEADPPKGRRVNVRKRPDRLLGEDIVDLLPDGALFVAFQRTTAGARPPGSNSTVWFGNRQGTEWVHDSGLRRVGGHE